MALPSPQSMLSPVATLSARHPAQRAIAVAISSFGTSLTNRERLLVSQGLTTVVYDVRPINRDDRLASSLASMQPIAAALVSPTRRHRPQAAGALTPIIGQHAAANDQRTMRRIWVGGFDHRYCVPVASR